jgi:hypothetical protein
LNVVLWHGLRFDQWIKMWDERGFRSAIASALYGIVRSPIADAKDRFAALQLINEAIAADVLAADFGYPELTRDALIAMILGERASWWQRIFAGPRRRRMRDQLRAARWMFGMAAQLIERSKQAQAEPEVVDAEVVDDTSYS